MYFSGDPSTRKRVDLGGRSSKERDRHKLLEQTRKERNLRLFHRQQNSAAQKIQKCYRAWKAVEVEQHKVREQFYSTYGNHCQNVDRHSFGPDSRFLRELMFLFNPRNEGDLYALAKTCQLLQHLAQDTGDVIALFAGMDYSSKYSLVDFRVKHLAYACIRAVHVNRSQFKKQSSSAESNSRIVSVLLEAIVKLVDPKLPWACRTVGYLVRRSAFALFREITLAAKESLNNQNMSLVSSLEQVLTMIVQHIGEKPCVCQNVDSWQSFLSQILTIPLVWKIFPHLKEVFAKQPWCKHYMHQASLHVQSHTNILPKDVSADYPGYSCLLGNILEASALALKEADSSFEMVVDLVAVSTCLMERLPPLKSFIRENKEISAVEDEEIINVEENKGNDLSEDLESQISDSIDARFLLQLINVLLGGIPSFTQISSPNDREVIGVGSACAFLHVTFHTLPLERMMTSLAYRTELVPVLWSFMKQCHETQKWSLLAEQSTYLPQGLPGWLLPLAVFCPVYKHMLMIVDNEEFYEQEKPLALKDIRYLIVILRQALWQLLWVNPVAPLHVDRSKSESLAFKKPPLEFLQQRVSMVVAELLTQLQDWNNRRQFTPSSDFHADGVNELFISQAIQENSRAREIIKQAPFLVPFTSRVKIFSSLLAAARMSDGSPSAFTGNRFTIRRDHILEDAYHHISMLSDDDLRERIRVTFVNEVGVEEAGVDGGGLFKDFMESVTKAAFDIQYGLFKETSDHLLYPNPGSGLVHEQHLQFFHFLGMILAKAMFEGILVDVPFAMFFLSKLKQKHNYLNDLPSLDQELYRHLIFLKRYHNDVSSLELYFVIVNNEYGEQTEVELVPGGKNMRVTNDNIIPFIHLIANHRLNYQIRQQSLHFLRGFQQLIRKEWIDIFNEHELQILISGSLDSLDIDDLLSHTQYSGGYHAEHYVIDMFWEVLKSFSRENQMRFLKFVTGCSRGPLLGFKFLEPQFCIQRNAGTASVEALDRLPTAATCMNLLKLPPYKSKEQLERKLLYAINSGAGFDLS